MITLVNNRENLVIKRDGRIEPFMMQKLETTVLWATDNDIEMTKTILREVEVSVYNKIHVTTLFDEVQQTVMKLASRIAPKYYIVLRNLEVMRIRKEANCNRNEYPHLEEYLKNTEKFLKTGESFKELPQFIFMRIAISAYIFDEDNNKVDKIIKRYNSLSNAIYTEATPKMISGGLLKDVFKHLSTFEINKLNNAIVGSRDFDMSYIALKTIIDKYNIRDNKSFASCVIHKMDDNSKSINRVVCNVGLYSRFGGGNALDCTSLRSYGSKIGLNGKGKGIVPTSRFIQSSIQLYNQLGMRKGACAVYYAWYGADILSFLKLLDEGGVEEDRARDLKIGVKINRLLLEAYKNDEYVYLFDPKDVPLLNESYGDDFEMYYQMYVDTDTYKQKIKAKDLLYAIALSRAETGNTYIFFTDNVNEQTIFNDMIYSSNLCSEVMLPTKATTDISETISLDLGLNPTVEIKNNLGLTAICNLSSINLIKWYYLTKEEKHDVAKELLESSDNLIEWGFYPTREGELFNKGYRAIGIGMSGQAYLFAKESIDWNSQQAENVMQQISIEMNQIFNIESKKLAKIRGSFLFINKTKLDEPRRFATLFAIAPTSSSSLVASTTEGIEPVKSVVYSKKGDGYKIELLVPDGEKYHYQTADEIDTKSLLKLASIRQKYLLDQGQSLNVYTKDPTSAKEIVDSFIMASDLGLLGLYYLVGKTSQDECFFCGS